MTKPLVFNYKDHEELRQAYKEMYDDVVQTIIKREKQFTNMVSVVRCKDCRHRDLFSCPLADNDFQKDDDYCSWGERREE